MKHRKRILLPVSLFLALVLFPFAAFATGEDVLEPAPAVPLAGEPAETEPSADEDALIPYLPYEYEYIVITLNGEQVSAEEQQYERSCLTDDEKERARRLMADLEAGKELTLNDLDCLDKTENVVVGVYPLDPADFHGETFYVILPAYRLTDDMLLSLISAFGRLGIPFDPDALNVMNCSRGQTQSRSLSYEESERMKAILFQVRRGMLTQESIADGTVCRTVQRANIDLDDDIFLLYPYRSMTDDELAAFALAKEGAWEIDPAAVEKEAREVIRSLLNAPLTLVLESEDRIRYRDGRTFYSDYFTIPYSDGVTGRTETPVGEPVEISVSHVSLPDSGQLRTESVGIIYNIDTSALEDSEWPDVSAGGELQWPDLSEEEWKALADDWIAEGLLKLPDGEVPKWQLYSAGPQDSRVYLAAETEGMYIFLTFARWNHCIQDCFVSFRY